MDYEKFTGFDFGEMTLFCGIVKGDNGIIFNAKKKRLQTRRQRAGNEMGTRRVYDTLTTRL